jgi:hypothetical protein
VGPEDQRLAETSGPAAATAGSRLILLLSSERSGSTLLRTLLGAHSRIVAPAELFLLMFPDFAAWRRRRPLAIISVLEYFEQIGRPVSVLDLERRLAEWSTISIYQWLLDQLPAGQFLLDKTPAYANSREILERTWTLAPRYIWLLRHPLGVVDSHLRVKRRSEPPLSRLLTATKDRMQSIFYGGISRKGRRREQQWVEQNTNIRGFLDSVPPGKKQIVLFENLLDQPHAVLASLCDHIGIDFEADMLKAVDEPNRVLTGLGDPFFHHHAGIENRPLAEWRASYQEKSLSRAAMELMEEIWTPRRRIPSHG